jgi:hypothetical protein
LKIYWLHICVCDYIFCAYSSIGLSTQFYFAFAPRLAPAVFLLHVSGRCDAPSSSRTARSSVGHVSVCAAMHPLTRFDVRVSIMQLAAAAPCRARVRLLHATLHTRLLSRPRTPHHASRLEAHQS